MSNLFSTIDDALEALAAGRPIIVVDAEDRENEGDFVAAAELATPEIVEFMISQGRGLVCMPILPELADRLQLHPMVDHNTSPHRTPYTVPVDHVSCHTGISAEERAFTIRSILDPKTRPKDLVRPGHLFPLVAKEGGVLRRAGHTEAAVDLARLAGLQPAGVICEITDGTKMAGRERLHQIAREFNLPMVSIEGLLRYRRRREKLVDRVASADMPTRFGHGRIIGYRVQHEPGNEPVALVMGDLTTVDAPLVRMHSSCFTGDLIGSLRCDCGDQLRMALERIEAEGVGALVYLPQEGRGIGLVEKIRAYHLQDNGMDTVEANLALGHPADPRDYGIGLQILKDLGLKKVRLLTNNPDKLAAFVYDGYDLAVVEAVPIIAPPGAERQKYMDTKRDKMGHLLPSEPDSNGVATAQPAGVTVATTSTTALSGCGRACPSHPNAQD
jgi:3,4-dihydroxy 2-butanone 4-phosphate synthase/GTP cyclohydrolase II